MEGSKEAGVLRVMSLGIMSRVLPQASLAAILAMGKPVALEASAEDRLTRGFISMITTSPVLGSTENCTLEPPHSTPILRMTSTEWSRRRWYSRSVRVWAGAMVMESPVWTPMGSRFSMEQMMTTLSPWSRMTSSSYSFQPSRDFSTRTWLVREASIPFFTICLNSSTLYATPPPVPPKVKAGRIIRGNSPIVRAISKASSIVVAVPDWALVMPISSMASLKRARSSARSMLSSLAPSSSTPYFARMPSSERAFAVFRPVWPPMVGKMASGFSFAIMGSRTSGVIGQTYVRSAVLGSVMIVAGLELMRMTLYPAALSALQAWVPE
mmetsp:Transcript_135/g.491  ORF Transcript_135/g.491 Transcript_135/m.491 type:complete len:325 (+) Transcript_135:2453-3427(+)